MRVPATALLLILASVIAGGCAPFEAWRECGWRGCPGDAQLTAAVEAALHEHPALEPPNLLYVRTSDRVVFLSGQVATDFQRETAVAAARQVRGVRRVINGIALEYDGR